MKPFNIERNSNSPSKEPPSSGAGKFFYLIGSNFWKLMKANLLFLVFSIPIITLPAAAGALSRITGKLVRDGYCLLWIDFWDEFKKGFISYLIIGLVSSAITAGGVGMLLLYSRTQSVLGIALFVIGILIIAFAICIFIHSITINANISLPVSAVLKDSLILTIYYSGRNFLMVACITVIAFIVYMFIPYSIIVALLILFSFLSLLITMILEERLYKHIINNYE